MEDDGTLVDTALSWVEINESNLAHNIRTFKSLVGRDCRLMVVVKANAYGHGMIPVSRIAVMNGADWLGVFSVNEAFELRRKGIDASILVLGPTPVEDLNEAAKLDIRLTLGSREAMENLIREKPKGLHIHLKLETGTNRQGIAVEDFPLVKTLSENTDVIVEGAYTHYADIEDTTDHSFAEEQLSRYVKLIDELSGKVEKPPVLHTACSAAALLFPDTYFNMTRVGIGAYGLWPSKETLVSAKQLGRKLVDLKPVMTWKTRIAQVKNLEPGAYVGYGRTFRATRPTRLAVLPVGYANGYMRGLSDKAHVLVHGRRAPLVGRVSMNIIMVDVTDVNSAAAGDEVVLLGKQGEETVPAEMMAAWLSTINYEVVTHVEPNGQRVVVADNHFGSD